MAIVVVLYHDHYCLNDRITYVSSPHKNEGFTERGKTVTHMPTLDNVRVGSYKTSGAWEKPPTPHLSDYHNHYNNNLFHSIEGSKFRKLEGYS